MRLGASLYYTLIGKIPVDLIMKMIEHSSKEGDLILDPFCGSGAVCVACKKMCRGWIGIELDKRYVEMFQ